MGDFFSQVWLSITSIKFMDAVDILLVAFLIYKGLTLIRSTRASRIAKSIVVLLIVTWLTSLFKMYMLNYILSTILSVGFVALLIMFQPELRRVLEKMGSRSTLREFLVAEATVTPVEQAIFSTVSACEILAKEKTGVLMVFEREMLLDEYFKSGTVLDATTSDQLIRNLFFTKAALHDGAVIVRNGRLAAAGCVLPLTENQHINGDLGTRHRAAIGMSEASDAVIVVVSEETGTISVAVNGMLKRHLAPKTLERILRTELIKEVGPQKPSFLQRVIGFWEPKGGNHEK